MATSPELKPTTRYIVWYIEAKIHDMGDNNTEPQRIECTNLQDAIDIAIKKSVDDRYASVFYPTGKGTELKFLSHFIDGHDVEITLREPRNGNCK